MQRVSAKRGFHRLVVLRERPFRQFIERKQATQPLLLHDKRPGVAPGGAVLKSGISFPTHLLPFHWISIRFASQGLPLISAEARLYSTRRLSGHAGPIQRIAQARRIGVITIRHLVTLLGPAAGIDPARRRGAAVIAQQREAIEQLAFSPAKCHFDRRDPPARSRCSLLPPLPIPDGPAACSASSSSAGVPRPSRLRCGTVRAGDGKSRQGFRHHCALHTGHPDLSSATAASGRVGDRTVLFSKAGRRQTEDFGLNRRRVDIIRLAVVLPEGRGFGHQRVDNHHIFQLAEAANHFVLSGKEATGLKPRQI